jgi:hypothetical protein
MGVFIRVFVQLFVGACIGVFAFADDQRKQTVETDDQGNTTRMLYHVNPDHGIFELKQTDKRDEVIQWYQYFVDQCGKVLIEVTRCAPGEDEKSTYESIRSIRYNVYRPDGNISEFYEFSGDGVLRQRVSYVYDKKGKWVEGIIFDSKGRKKGKELTPPEARLYGKKQN